LGSLAPNALHGYEHVLPFKIKLFFEDKYVYQNKSELTNRSLYRTLACNEECSIAERNKRLAAALEIQDPDCSSHVKQDYSDFLKNMAKLVGDKRRA